MIFTKQEADETAEEENLTPPDKQPLVKALDDFLRLAASFHFFI